MMMTQEEASEFYGADATEWLRRWDDGRVVWSVEMGGLGPGYEQCIQVMVAEALRVLLRDQPDPDAWADPIKWASTLAAIENDHAFAVTVKRLGGSGAQFGAAINLATLIYRRGPVDCFSDPAVKDRLIQVQRDFPA